MSYLASDPDLAPVDRAATATLRRGLCESTNTGIRPSFSDSGALSGYTLSNLMKRSWNAPALLMLRGDAAMARLRARLLLHRHTLCIASVGGGPGYDALGMALLCERLRLPVRNLFALVLDVHLEWASAVSAMSRLLAAGAGGDAGTDARHSQWWQQ